MASNTAQGKKITLGSAAQASSAADIFMQRQPALLREEQREAHLNPTEQNALPAPFELLGSHEACELVSRAIHQNKKIAVYGDYDADGNTASTIVSHFISDYTGEKPLHYIPWRKEGYGLSKAGIDALRAQGAETLIVVDCGTTSASEVAYAKSCGMEVVIIDHHQPRPQDPLPDCPLINPSRLDEKFPHKSICAAGLAYLFGRDLHTRLKQIEHYDVAAREDKNPQLVAAAIGTVADVMRLDHPVNRYLVKAGLAEMNSRKYTGINALMDYYGLKTLDETHIGFLIGPLLNAAGRMGQPDLGYQLLTARDSEEARTIARQLIHANNERKILTESTAKEAFEKAEAYLATHKNTPFLMLDDPRWDKGIVGIVASRLKERYGIPVALGGSYTGPDGVERITYSVRSIPGVDFFHKALNPLQRSGEPDLLSGGGHAMAAGMTITGEGKERVMQAMTTGLAADVEAVRKSERLAVDAVKTLDDFQEPAFVRELYHLLGPVGTGVPAPRFLVKAVQVGRVNRMGPNHQDLSITLRYPDRKDVILPHGNVFRALGTKLGKFLTSPTRHRETLDVVIEPYLYETNQGKLAVGYRIIDSYPPKKIEKPIAVQTSQLERIRTEEDQEQKAKEASIAQPRRIEDIYDVTNAKAQAALKTLYDHHLCLYDTETTGKNAGKAFRTNGITQIAALKVEKDANGNYIPVIKEWHVSPQKNTYYAYQRKDQLHLDKLHYSLAKFEYVSDPEALDVTGLNIVRDTPNGEIKAMRIGDEDIKDARPFHEIAGDVFDFMKDSIPYAYNGPFDHEVLARHFQEAANTDAFYNLHWLNKQYPDQMHQLVEDYGREVAHPLSARMEANPKFMQMLDNPAHWHCAMYGAFVHKGIFRRNRVTHMAERYGLSFTRDDKKHDAVEDVGPLVFIVADQIEHFGKPADMATLWQKELQKIHPAFRVEAVDYRREKFDRHGELIAREVIPGQLKVSYPEALKDHPKIKAVSDFLIGFHQVQRFNRKARSQILEHGTQDEVSGDPFITLLNKTKNSNTTTHWLRLLKTFTKWSISTGQQQPVGQAPVYPAFNYRCYDYSSRADFTLTDKDGTPKVIEDVPLGAFRRSEDFITLPEQRERMADYLESLRFLDQIDFTGIATITPRGIEVSGVRREFGDMTIAIPPQGRMIDFLQQNRDQIKELLKISGIPMVKSAYLGDDYLDAEDKQQTLEEEREQINETISLAKPKFRLNTKISFSPNPQVEMELSRALLKMVGKHMEPPVDFTLNQTYLSGLTCESVNGDGGNLRLSGNLEAFKEIGPLMRNAAWLMYRLQTLPSVRASQTVLDEKSETITLYCSPAPRIEDLWVLDRAHVPCHVYKDRIEINLSPLMHDPYHWYWELSKELTFVKANRKRVNKIPEPQALKDVNRALVEGKIDAYHTNRDHDAWIDVAGMRNIHVDMKNGGLLRWPTSTLQNNVAFPKSVSAMHGQKIVPNLAHLLCDSIGHTQLLPGMYSETVDGIIHLRVPHYSKLGTHFQKLGETYRNDLGRSAISLNINPLLDAMRAVAEDPDMQIPNAASHDEKARRLASLYQKFSALLPQLQTMHTEAHVVWEIYKNTPTGKEAFREVATLDHLRLELLKQTQRYPNDTAIKEKLETVQKYFERISLAEFKKYRLQMDLITPANKKDANAPEDEGKSGALPALEKALTYLCGDKESYYKLHGGKEANARAPRRDKSLPPLTEEEKKERNKARRKAKQTAQKSFFDEALQEGALEAKPTPDFQAMDDYQLHNAYLEMERAFFNLWRANKKLHRTLLFNHEITATGMLLNNPTEREKLGECAAYVHDISQRRLMRRLEYLQSQGLIEHLVVTDNGITCKPTEKLKSDPNRYATELVKLPEQSGVDISQETQGYPVILTKAAMLHLLDARHPLESKNDFGLLAFTGLWNEHGKGKLIITDGLLQSLLNSPTPVRLEELFTRDARGKWLSIDKQSSVISGQNFKTRQVLEFIRIALNRGALFEQTPASRNQGSSSDKEPADIRAARDVVARLNHELSGYLPVVLYDGANADAFLQHAEHVATGMATHTAVISSQTFTRMLMETAKKSGAFLLHPEEIAKPETYAHLTFARAAKRGYVLDAHNSVAPTTAFNAEAMAAAIEAQGWKQAFTARAQRMETAGNQIYQSTATHYGPVYAMKQALDPKPAHLLPAKVEGQDIAALMSHAFMSPAMAAERLAQAVPKEQWTAVMAAMDQRANALHLAGPRWAVVRQELLQELEKSPEVSPKNENDLVMKFRASFLERCTKPSTNTKRLK